MPAILGLTITGALIGTVTGLLPGIHPNTLIFTSLPYLITLQPRTALPLLVTAAVSHSILNHIPAILIGVPDENSALTSLPGKKMVVNGKGSQAIQATLNGGLYTAVLSIFIIPLAFALLPQLYPLLRPYLVFIISMILGYMILAEDRPLIAVGITVLCGVLGTFALNAPINSSKSLFPLFLGLFGVPVLLATTDNDVPPQKTVSVRPLSTLGYVIGTSAGFISGMLPGLGPSATVALFDRFLTRKRFLIALGGINTADALFSIVALHTIGNPRSGASVAVQKLISPDTGTALLVIGCSLIGIAVSYSVGQLLLPYILSLYPNLEHRRFSLITATVLSVLVIPVSGIGGLTILIAATGTGLLVQELQIRKSICMACLILPFLLQEIGIIL